MLVKVTWRVLLLILLALEWVLIRPLLSEGIKQSLVEARELFSGVHSD